MLFPDSAINSLIARKEITGLYHLKDITKPIAITDEYILQISDHDREIFAVRVIRNQFSELYSALSAQVWNSLSPELKKSWVFSSTNTKSKEPFAHFLKRHRRGTKINQDSR